MSVKAKREQYKGGVGDASRYQGKSKNSKTKYKK